MAVKEYTPSSDKKIHKTSTDFILRNCPREVHIVQYDKTQPIVEVELFNNGKRYSLPENAVMNLRFSKPDRTFVYKAVLGCNKDRNIVYFDIDQQMSFLYGKVNPILELVLDDTIAGSSPIPIEIDRNPIQNGDLESSSEYPAIVEAANKALEASSKAEKAASEATEAITTLQPLLDLYNAGDIASKTWVTSQLSSYVTTKYFEDALEGYLTIFDADNTYATKIELKDYALKTDIPDTSDFVTDATLSSELKKYLPLTGGTLSGALQVNSTLTVQNSASFSKNYIHLLKYAEAEGDVLFNKNISLQPKSTGSYMEYGRVVSLTDYIGSGSYNKRDAHIKPGLEMVGYNSNFHGNRFFGLDENHIIIEYSNDAGATWKDYGATKYEKLGFLSGIDQVGFRLGGKNATCSCSNMLRISITVSNFNVPEGTAETDKIKYWTKDNRTGANRYFSVNSLYFWQTDAYNYHQVVIERGTYSDTAGTEPTWTTIGTLDRNSGRPAGTSVSFDIFSMGSTAPASDQILRLTFRTQTRNNDFDDSKLENVSSSYQNIRYIKAFGLDLYQTDYNYKSMVDDSIFWYTNTAAVKNRLVYSCASISPQNLADSKLLCLGTSDRPWANVYTRCINVISRSSDDSGITPYVELNNGSDKTVYNLSNIFKNGAYFNLPSYSSGTHTLATLDDIPTMPDMSKYLPLTGGTLTGDLSTNSSIKFDAGKLYENEKQVYLYGGYSGSMMSAVNCETLYISGKKASSQGNRFFGLPTEQMIFEYSTDGGTTWNLYELSNDDKVEFISNDKIRTLFWLGNSSGLSSCNNIFRITLTGAKFNVPVGTSESDRIKYWNKTRFISNNRYCRVNSIYTNQNANYNAMQCKMYVGQAPETDTAPTFNLFRTWNNMKGWNTGSSFFVSGIYWGDSTIIRLEFRTQANDGSFDDSKLTNASTSGQNISYIQAYGDEVYDDDMKYPQMKTGNIFSYSNGWQIVNRYANIHCTLVPYENGIQGFGQSNLRFRHLYLNDEWLYGKLKLFKNSAIQADDKALTLYGNGIDKLFSLDLPNNEGALFSIQKGDGINALVSDIYHFEAGANDEDDLLSIGIINKNGTQGMELFYDGGAITLSSKKSGSSFVLSDKNQTNAQCEIHLVDNSKLVYYADEDSKIESLSLYEGSKNDTVNGFELSTEQGIVRLTNKVGGAYIELQDDGTIWVGNRATSKAIL